MRWPALFVSGTIAVRLLGAADWIKVSSANFDLLTTAGEQDARQTLESFELARDFFLRFEPSLAGSPSRVTIVGFSSLKEYRPYSKKGSTLAYFLANDQDDYIVMSDLETQRMRIAIHEYVHLLVRHSGLSIPLWLNEGMAEVYSTLEKKEGKLLMGGIPDDRAQALGQNNWIRVPALLTADVKSREYNEPQLDVMFYAQSCLLTHMLMLGDDYRTKFSSFVDRIAATGSAQTAFAEVYGSSLGDIEKAMNAYFRQTVINGNRYTAAPVKFEIGQAQPAGDAEVGTILANLASYVGRAQEARNRLQKLAATYPGVFEIEESLGNLEFREGDRDAALAHYRLALGHHPAGWKVYWNYARTLEAMGGDIKLRLQALEDALERKPDLTEARLLLGHNLCAVGRFSEALVQLKQIKNVDSKYVFAMYMNLAQAALGLKQDDKAREYADGARKAVRNSDESAIVDRFLERLQQNAHGESTVMREVPEPDSERPILRRTPGKKVPKQP